MKKKIKKTMKTIRLLLNKQNPTFFGCCKRRQANPVAAGCALFLFGSVLFCCADSIVFQGIAPDKPVLADGGSPIPVFVIDTQNPFLTAPSRKGNTIGKSPAFLERFYLCDQVTVKDQRYILLGQLNPDQERIDSFRGWVPAEQCIEGLHALKTREGIYRKALIINKWSAKDLEKGQLNVAPLYEHPSRKSEVLQKLGLFNFFYVWKEISTDEGVFWLIGPRPYIESLNRPDDSIIGWISASRALGWSTRQAVQFDKSNLQKRTESVPIFQRRSELNEWLSGGSLSDPMAKEVTSVTKWEPHWMRFPLLDLVPGDGGRDGASANIMKVGYIGDQVEVGSGNRITSAWGAANNRKKIEELRQMTRSIDVLLVIDGTGSMESYFMPVAQAVLQTFERLNKSYADKSDCKPDFRFSVVFYRDYYDPSTLVKQMDLTDKLNEVTQYIVAEQPSQGAGANPNDRRELTEAVFYGICYGLEHAEFREGSYRQVVVMGDRGNHPGNKDKRGYTEQSVARSLKKYDANLIALHVAGDRSLNPEKEDWYDPQSMLFKEQFLRIAKILERDNEISTCSYLHKPAYDEVTAQIVSGCEKAMETNTRIRDSLKALAYGDNLKLVEEKHGVEISMRLQKMMEKAGLSVGDFRESGAQICEVGWVSDFHPKTGLKQMENMLLVRRTEMTTLLSLLNRLAKQRVSNRSLRDLWKKSLETEIGKDCSYNINLNDYISMHTGLPVRSKLLSYNLNQLANMSQGERNNMIFQLKDDQSKVSALLFGNRANVWFLREGISYAWIKRSDLP